MRSLVMQYGELEIQLFVIVSGYTMMLTLGDKVDVAGLRSLPLPSPRVSDRPARIEGVPAENHRDGRLGSQRAVPACWPAPQILGESG